MNKEVALGFTAGGVTKLIRPVLFQIIIGKGSYGRYFKLDQAEYSI
jgi:hypothetical protein